MDAKEEAYHRLCDKCWEALGITEYTGKSIPEHIKDLEAKVEELEKDLKVCRAVIDSDCETEERSQKIAREVLTEFETYGDSYGVHQTDDNTELLVKKIKDLEAKVELAKEKLKEITKGEGRYNPDNLTHASNTIEDMKELAKQTLKQLEG